MQLCQNVCALPLDDCCILDTRNRQSLAQHLGQYPTGVFEIPGDQMSRTRIAIFLVIAHLQMSRTRARIFIVIAHLQMSRTRIEIRL